MKSQVKFVKNELETSGAFEKITDAIERLVLGLLA